MKLGRTWLMAGSHGLNCRPNLKPGRIRGSIQSSSRLSPQPVTPTCQAGLVGPRMTALIGYLKGAYHCSFSTIRKYLRDVVGATISRGQLRKVCGKVASSLDHAYEGLLAILPTQKQLTVDETGHKENARGCGPGAFGHRSSRSLLPLTSILMQVDDAGRLTQPGPGYFRFLYPAWIKLRLLVRWGRDLEAA